MAAAIAQHASGHATAAGSITATLAAKPTVGNLLLAGLSGNVTTAWATMPTDWTPIVSARSNGSNTIYLWWKIATSSDNAALTVATTSVTNADLHYNEFSGAGTDIEIEGISSFVGTANTTSQPTNPPSTAVGDLLYMFNGTSANQTSGGTNGAGYTSTGDFPGRSMAAWKAASATTMQQQSLTVATNSRGNAVTVAFRTKPTVSWLNRTPLDPTNNKGASNVYPFAPATAGNQLLMIIGGSATSFGSAAGTPPDGWSEVKSAVANTGLYAWTKTATAGESSVTVNHNGSNYLFFGAIYEFPAGTAVVGTAGAATGMARNTTGPAATGLSGTYAQIAARTVPYSTQGQASECVWTVPANREMNAGQEFLTTPAGVGLSIAYVEGQTGASFTPNSNYTGGSGNGEGIAFALLIGSGAAPVPITLRGVIAAGGTEVAAGATLRGVINASGMEDPVTVREFA